MPKQSDQDQAENRQLQDLQTHFAAAEHLHETRTADHPEQIDPPVVPNPGPYDTREGKFENKFRHNRS